MCRREFLRWAPLGERNSVCREGILKMGPTRRKAEVCKRLYVVSQSCNHVVYSCVWTTVSKILLTNYKLAVSQLLETTVHIPNSKHLSYRTSLNWETTCKLVWGGGGGGGGGGLLCKFPKREWGVPTFQGGGIKSVAT